MLFIRAWEVRASLQYKHYIVDIDFHIGNSNILIYFGTEAIFLGQPNEKDYLCTTLKSRN